MLFFDIPNNNNDDSDKNEGYLKTNITHQFCKADVNRKKEENALKWIQLITYERHTTES